MWVASYVVLWSTLELESSDLPQIKAKVCAGGDDGCLGFLPVFNTREEAVAWTGNEHVMEIRTQSEKEVSDALDTDGVNPTEEDGL